MVTFMIAYMRHAPDYISECHHLQSLLGIVQYLLHSPCTEEQGFRLLNSIFLNISRKCLHPRMNEVFAVLVQQMQDTGTMKFARQFILSMSVAAVSQGPQVVVTAINSANRGSFYDLRQHKIQPNIKSIRGKFARKATALGFYSLCTDVEEIRASEPVKSTLLDWASQALSGQVETSRSEGKPSPGDHHHTVEQMDEEETINSQHCRLTYAVDPGHEAHPVDPDYFPWAPRPGNRTEPRGTRGPKG